MGRNAGWLTAASALARIEGRKVPQLIYLCEKTFDEDRFIEDVNEALKVDMLQFAAFDVVKSAAEEIGMVYPKEESTISIDMSKEYFSHIKEEEKGNSSLFGKLIEIFN